MDVTAALPGRLASRRQSSVGGGSSSDGNGSGSGSNTTRRMSSLNMRTLQSAMTDNNDAILTARIMSEVERIKNNPHLTHLPVFEEARGDSEESHVTPDIALSTVLTLQEEDFNTYTLLRDYYHVFAQPLPFNKAVIKTTLELEQPLSRNHLIVCGDVPDLAGMVLALRNRKSNSTIPIVLLHTMPPTRTLWRKLQHFRGIYYVRGTPAENSRLKAAGIKFAKHVIIFPSMSSLGTGLSLESEIDTQTVFSYRTILGENPAVNCMCEILNRDKLALLQHATITEMSESADANCVQDIFQTELKGDSILRPVFATGKIYLSAFSDQMVARNICRASSSDVQVLGALLDETPFRTKHMLELIEPNFGKTNLSSLGDGEIPAEFHNKTYEEVFEHFLDQHVVCIALLRGTMSKVKMGVIGNRSQYLLCNPEPHTVVYSCDRVICLSHELLKDSKKAFTEVATSAFSTILGSKTKGRPLREQTNVKMNEEDLKNLRKLSMFKQHSVRNVKQKNKQLKINPSAGAATEKMLSLAEGKADGAEEEYIDEETKHMYRVKRLSTRLASTSPSAKKELVALKKKLDTDVHQFRSIIERLRHCVETLEEKAAADDSE